MSSKLREALEEILNLAYIAKDDEGRITNDWLINTCRSALAEPPRNCEVGTIEQQVKRFYDEYYAENSRCKRRWSFGECALHWAQMSYEKTKGVIEYGNDI